MVEQVAQDEPGLGLEEATGRVATDEVEGVGDEGADSLLGLSHRLQHLVEAGAEPHLVVVGRRGQDVVPAREVAVQGAPRHPGGVGDLRHPQALHALPADEAEGGGEDALFSRGEGPGGEGLGH